MEVRISDVCKQDVLDGKADYVRHNELHFDSIAFGNDLVQFCVGNKVVADMPMPKVSFIDGDTLTLELVDGKMAIRII